MGDRIKLPPVDPEDGVTLNVALRTRRSRRDFCPAPIDLEQLSQLLWAGQGLSGTRSRTVPSAGALYPLEQFVVVSRVETLRPGVYHHICEPHELELLGDGDIAGSLSDAALRQRCVRDAAVTIIVAADYERTAGKYGDRAGRYVAIEVGHLGQNLLLQATALGLAATPIGAFDDLAVRLLLRTEWVPMYLLSVGVPR